MDTLRPVRRALISVSDKTGIVEFARTLTSHGVEILSTGGTFKLLTENGVNAIEVSDHPKIHGGILARRGIDDAVMAANDIEAIDMVVVNLYPFANTVANPDCTMEDAVENIDIGGPTMVRAAAKNHKDVTIVVNAKDYDRIINELNDNNGATKFETRFDLAIAAYEHTAQYDGMIANYFGKMVPDYSDNAEEVEDSKFPRTYNLQFSKKLEMRYGENSHQQAAFYVESEVEEASISTATQLQGKALSYNNIADTDAALECVKGFERPACVIVKHANPCGVAENDTILEAYNRAYKTDPTSAFGGIIAFNRELDADTAEAIVSRQFVEVIIAPSISAEAAQIVAAKKNVRLLETGLFLKFSRLKHN